MGGLAIFSSTMSKSPVLPLFAGSLGIPDKTLGFVAAASTIVGILVSFPAATLSDFIGRRRLLLIAAFVFATAPFGYLFVHNMWSLVLVRVYHGLATAILGPIAMAAVADTYSTGRGEKMAWYSSATMVGRFLAPLLGGALIMGSDYPLGVSGGWHSRRAGVGCGFIYHLPAESLGAGQLKGKKGISARKSSPSSPTGEFCPPVWWKRCSILPTARSRHICPVI